MSRLIRILAFIVGITFGLGACQSVPEKKLDPLDIQKVKSAQVYIVHSTSPLFYLSERPSVKKSTSSSNDAALAMGMAGGVIGALVGVAIDAALDKRKAGKNQDRVKVAPEHWSEMTKHLNALIDTRQDLEILQSDITRHFDRNGIESAIELVALEGQNDFANAETNSFQLSLLNNTQNTEHDLVVIMNYATSLHPYLVLVGNASVTAYMKNDDGQYGLPYDATRETRQNYYPISTNKAATISAEEALQDIVNGIDSVSRRTTHTISSLLIR